MGHEGKILAEIAEREKALVARKAERDREIAGRERDLAIRVEEEARDRWIEEHSVECYFCGDLVDERERSSADEWNRNDGGDMCHACFEVREGGTNF